MQVDLLRLAEDVDQARAAAVTTRTAMAMVRVALAARLHLSLHLALCSALLKAESLVACLLGVRAGLPSQLRFCPQSQSTLPAMALA